MSKDFSPEQEYPRVDFNLKSTISVRLQDRANVFVEKEQVCLARLYQCNNFQYAKPNGYILHMFSK